MSKLCQKFFLAIDEKNEILLKEYIESFADRVFGSEFNNNEMTYDEREQMSEFSENILNEATKVISMRRDINNIKNGEKSDFVYEFVKDVCKNSVIT